MENKEYPKNTELSSDDIPVFIIAGPTGCGKSTIGKAISTQFHFAFIEGDDLHPPRNIAKMSSGMPLIDDDRWDWLDNVISTAQLEESEHHSSGIVVTCSSLRPSYRDRIRKRVEEGRRRGSQLREYFMFCHLSEAESVRRVQQRPGHFLKADMVASQFADLEPPDPEVEPRVYVLNVEKSITEVKKEAINHVRSFLDGAGA